MLDLLDITEVCRMLGITSRTLRFYEQKGIIDSTVEPFGNRRKYSDIQLKNIKNVLVLRSLGLSVSKIKEIQSGNNDLSLAVRERKAELLASVTTKTKELNLLDETLAIIESGEDIYQNANEKQNITDTENERLSIVKTCTDAFISGEYSRCYEHFAKVLCEYMPLSAFERVIEDTQKPLGGFVAKDRIVVDGKLPNVVYSYLQYEKLGLYIKYVFHGKEIHGVWLNYYEVK